MWAASRFTANDVRAILAAAKARPPVSHEAAVASAAALNRLATVINAPDGPSVIARRDHARHIERAARALFAALHDEGLDALEPAEMRGGYSAEAARQARAMARGLIHAARISATAWDAACTKGGRPHNTMARALAFHGAHAYHAALLRVPSAKEDGPALRFIAELAAALDIEAPPATVSRVIAEMVADGVWRGWGAKPGA